jgi:hypothetical protein
MRPLRYYRARVRLARAWPRLPVGLLILVLGLWGVVFAQGNITPSSVSVSGYYRSNGSYVRPYHRRPPGSVRHDQPYEMLWWVALLSSGGGGYLLYTSSRRLFFDDPETLLPPLPYKAPPRPPRSVVVPRIAVRAKRQWACRECGRPINRGQQYWTDESGGHRSRGRATCGACSVALSDEERTRTRRRSEYEEALNRYRDEQTERMREHFRNHFGCDP